MEQLSVENLVIGFGKAGKTLATDLAKAGQSVILVEQSEAMYGGTCINIGCIPSKNYW
ncbi:pyridine nucleotide-disulfide oxidoreductase [Actinobacillus equuli]|nr:pyridine nucleotide-disulfide oxidoreductase [Actinobacillus equuli]